MTKKQKQFKKYLIKKEKAQIDLCWWHYEQWTQQGKPGLK